MRRARELFDPGRRDGTPCAFPSWRAQSDRSTFSHPDCTVGSGLTPDLPHPRTRLAGSALPPGRAIPPVGNLTLPRRSLLLLL